MQYYYRLCCMYMGCSTTQSIHMLISQDHVTCYFVSYLHNFIISAYVIYSFFFINTLLKHLWHFAFKAYQSVSSLYLNCHR